MSCGRAEERNANLNTSSEVELEDSSADEAQWMERAGRACTGAPFEPAEPGSPGAWLLDWGLGWGAISAPLGAAADEATVERTQNQRRPRGLVRTACESSKCVGFVEEAPALRRGLDAAARTGAAVRVQDAGRSGGGGFRGGNRAPGGGLGGGGATRGQSRSPARRRGQSCERAAARIPKQGSIEAACNGRWFSRLSPSLVVGRKPLSVRELMQLKDEEKVQTILSGEHDTHAHAQNTHECEYACLHTCICIYM